MTEYREPRFEELDRQIEQEKLWAVGGEFDCGHPRELDNMQRINQGRALTCRTCFLAKRREVANRMWKKKGKA